jgi:DNA/RNA endonuclease G (NUC1)
MSQRLFLATSGGFAAGALLASMKYKQLDRIEPSAASANPNTTQFVAGVGPGQYGLPSQENLLHRPHYIASVNYRTRIPNWVAQHLTPTSIVGEGDRKDVRFQADDEVEAPFQYDKNWLECYASSFKAIRVASQYLTL